VQRVVAERPEPSQLRVFSPLRAAAVLRQNSVTLGSTPMQRSAFEPDSWRDKSVSVRAAQRRCLLISTAGLALATLGACSRREPLRIGFLGGLSGRVADLGIGGRNGTQIAVDQINAGGGVAGRAAELLIRDDEQSPDLARARFDEMVNAGAQLVVGPMTSAIAVAVAPLALKRGVPLVSPTSTTHELSGIDDAFFRLVPDAPTGARQQAGVLHRDGARKLATVFDTRNRAFSESWTQAAERKFAELGGEVALALPIESVPGLAYAEKAAAVVASRADTALLATNAADAAVLSQHLRRLAPKIVIATSPWSGTEQLIEMGGRGVEAALVPQYFDRASRAEPYLRFIEAHRQRFGDAPGFPAVNAFDATMLGVRALRERRDGQTVLAALRAIRAHDGMQRRIEIDAFGDSRAPMFLTRVRDGRFVPIEA
jgi:branched-chain amino acid transport system substrate-binding protein